MKCEIRDITFFYEDIGSGRPLLVLHGWPLDHRHVAADMEPLFAERSGWRRIYPDLPGFGRTAAPEWLESQDQMLDLVGEFMDTVAPNQRFALAGTSWGGYLARGLMRRRGEDIDGLLLSVPHFATDERRGALPERRVLREDGEFLAALQPGEESAREIVVMQSMEVLEDQRRSILPAIPLHDEAFGERMDEHFSFPLELPQPFPAPALIVTGRFDQACGYEDAYRVLPDFPRATFAVLDCAGHALPMERKGPFHALAADWLDRVEEYAG
ncbi:MAG: alpha/beta fold hydrolase [Gaiellaceae bacterium]